MYISTHISQAILQVKVMSHDALRMRLKRLCERKQRSNKCHVDEATHEQYVRGGPGREWLEMALLESLQKVGADSTGKRGNHKAVVVPCLHVATINKSIFLYDFFIQQSTSSII